VTELILQRCTGCDKRCETKPFSTTFAWRRADLVRVAWRAILCMPCYIAKVVPLDFDMLADARLTCPSCHIDTEDDFDAIYVTSFIPNYGKRQIQAPFCGACAAHYRIWVQEHAVLLQDSVGATGGPYSDVLPEDVLRSLGIIKGGAA